MCEMLAVLFAHSIIMSSNSTIDTISISQAIENSPTFCAKCHAPPNEGGRLLSCTRCRLARYCSRACQKHHLILHKSGCKRIASIREQLETEEDPENISILLGDALVEVTYRSSHSLKFSKDGLASAIQCYMQAMQHPNTSSSQRIKVAFLLAAIGQDEAAASVIYYDTIAHRNDNTLMPDSIPKIDPHDDILALVPSDVEWNTTNLVILLFLKMKLVARDGNDAIQRTLMENVKSHINPQVLDAIRHTIPLDSPVLFDSTTPFELKCLLQDVFFMTRGVNELLFEGDDDEHE